MTPEQGPDHLSRAEIAKDAIQAGAEATAHTVGQVAGIVSKAVGEVASAVGGLATELFEIGDASRRAAAAHGDGPDQDDPAPDVLPGADSPE